MATTTTVTIDDDLLERAIVVSGISKKDDVLREALTALIHRGTMDQGGRACWDGA